MVRRSGQMGVPVTEVGGELVVGFDRPRLERLIQRLRMAARPASLGAAVKDAPGGGALVGVVHPHTAAARGGLMAGDVIVALDGTPAVDAGTLAGVVQAASARGTATLTVRRGSRTLTLAIAFGPG